MTPEQRNRQPVFRNQLPPDEETQPESKVDFIGYFKNHGEVSLTPSEKKPFKGKILPAFDWSVSVVDDSFNKSYHPYRDELGSYAGFFLIAWVHSYFGNSQNRFISPLTWKNLAYIPGEEDQDKADPVNDMQDFAFNDSTKKYAHLLMRKAGGGAPPLSKATERVFFNAYGRRGNEEERKLTIIDMSASARKNLLNNKLAALRPSDVKVWDKNYPEYLFGDVTDPKGGAVVRSIQETMTTGTNTYKYTGMAFNDNNVLDNTDGMRSYACMELLEKRYNLWSSDLNVNPLIILSYQEIVDFIIEDGFMPVELVKEACSHHANIGANPRGPLPPRTPPKSVPPPARKEAPSGPDPMELIRQRQREDAEIQKRQEEAERRKAEREAEAAASKEKEYFASCKGMFDVTEKSQSEIQKLLDEGYAVRIYYGDKWLGSYMLEPLGFKLPRPPEPKREEPKKRPPPPPPDDDDDAEPTDTYVAPMGAPKPAPPPPPPVEEEVTKDTEVLTDLDEDDLRILKVGYALYRNGKGKVEATPDFSVTEVNRFLLLFAEYNVDGSFKTT